MRLGLLLFADGNDSRSLANQAKAVEAAGFDSIWCAHALGRGFMLADPLLALSVAGTVTESVELGTAILQLPLYNPVDVAAKVFTLQHLSGSRLLLGLGVGSTEQDFLIHKLPYADRFRIFESSLASLRRAFADGSAGSGNLNPWPTVAGGPPVLLGTWGRKVQRAATDFDGWIASAMYRTPEQCRAALSDYRAAGGKRAVISSIRAEAGGDPGKLRDRLQGYAEAGFDDAVVMISPGGPSLDQIRSLVQG